MNTSQRYNFRAYLSVLSMLFLLSGCAFHKSVTNDAVRRMDTSFIRLNETTSHDVVTRFGPPPPLPDNLQREKVFTEDFLRYSCIETKTARFEIGYILILPFAWTDTQAVDEILIELNPDRTVRNVVRTRRETRWAPLESEDSRKPAKTQCLSQKGGAK